MKMSSKIMHRVPLVKKEAVLFKKNISSLFAYSGFCLVVMHMILFDPTRGNDAFQENINKNTTK